MRRTVPAQHPLRHLFAVVTERCFLEGIGWPGRLDYVETGKRSYRIASEFSYGGHAGEVPLFRKLSEDFELCVFGLGYVRADLKRLRNPRLQRMWGTLLS
ncbi:MAG: hypothetical protein V3W05_02680 [candidate division NC10 bacterium]